MMKRFLEVCQTCKSRDLNGKMKLRGTFMFTNNSKTSTFYHHQRSVLIKLFKSLINEHEADITIRWVRGDRVTSHK